MAPKRDEVISAALAFAQASFSTRAWFGLPENAAFTGSISMLREVISRFELGGTTVLYRWHQAGANAPAQRGKRQ